MISKISKNEPYPCDSGKKHKKCCLGKTPPSKPMPKFPAVFAVKPQHGPFIDNFSSKDDFDELSNFIRDLVTNGNLDVAEEHCFELISKFPNTIDVYECRALLLEARGEIAETTVHYRRVALFANGNEDFHSEVGIHFWEKANELDRLGDSKA